LCTRQQVIGYHRFPHASSTNLDFFIKNHFFFFLPAA
jgi:hypothetical protein